MGSTVESLVIRSPFCNGNRDVKLEYKALKQREKEFNKKDAQFYGNIFAKMNKMQPFNSNVSSSVAFPISKF